MGNFLRLVNGIPRHQAESAASFTTYRETYVVNSTISTGTPITLPASGTYTNKDLWVFLNNVPQTPVYDYNYEGTPPRTQISFTYDLRDGDVIEFKIVPE